MRLATGALFPLPVTLDIHEEDLVRLGLPKPMGQKTPEPSPRLALCQNGGLPLAILNVTDIFTVNKKAAAQAVFSTQCEVHPGVATLLSSGSHTLGGPLEAIQLPERPAKDAALCLTPSELRSIFKAAGYQRVVAFQTRNPMHRAHFELTKRAAATLNAHLLLHPAIGPTQPGDVPPLVRIAAYKALIPRFPKHTVTLSLLPLAMRMGGPREALLHAIIRRNYGATHFIIGRDHAGPAPDPLTGRPFYDPYDAQVR
jgi:sulfate adenylyltransferase